MSNKSKRHLHPVPVAAAPAERPVYEVGAVIAVSEDVTGRLATGLARFNELHRLLGVLTEDYEARRDLLLRNLGETRQAYNEQVKQTAIGLGINLGPESKESWTFTPDRREFVRKT